MYKLETKLVDLVFLGSSSDLVREAIEASKTQTPSFSRSKLIHRIEYRVDASLVSDEDYAALMKAYKDSEGQVKLIVERFEEANDKLEHLLLIAKGLKIEVEQDADEVPHSQEGIASTVP